MLKKIFLVVFALACLLACQNNPASDQKPASATSNAPKEAAERNFGEVIDQEGAISYGTLIRQMEGRDSLATKVKARVEAVCQAKGCWMNLSGSQTAEEMLVQFKDYGFFVPKDISGREVIVEGYAFREVTPVDELRHFAKDEGLPQSEIDAITEPKEELKFLASGVLLLD